MDPNNQRLEATPPLKQPRSRDDFRIAIICALSREGQQVELVLDRNWTTEGLIFGKAHGDHNTYTAGAIGRYNVVLAYMPGMGGNNAALTAAALRSSFPRIELVLVVGICGTTPYHIDSKEEIVLGDTIISTGIVQYDYGRWYPNKFVRKTGIQDSTGQATLLVRSLLAKLTVSRNQDHLTRRQHDLLGQMSKISSCIYPGAEQDHLFESAYIHTHHNAIVCPDCVDGTNICGKSCKSLGCNMTSTVRRKRLDTGGSSIIRPRIHFGCYGSGNAVLKSGTHRDELAREYHLVAFEMEAAGVWDIFPSVIIKSACDYADSHKNKIWQDYASATAAAAAKALLEMLELPEIAKQDTESIPMGHLRLEQSTPAKSPVRNPLKLLPFTRDKDFTGREEILQKLLRSVEEQASSYQLRAGLVGMGGVGKSQIAIEFAYRLQDIKPGHSVYWIHCSTSERFTQGYQDIATLANITVPENSKILDTVHRWLSNQDNGSWCLILDNVDDDAIFTQQREDGKILRDYLPTASHGIILVTSRYKLAARNLIENNTIYEIDPMDAAESLSLLKTRLPVDYSDESLASELVKALEYLPLAIVHAGSYIQMRQPSITLSKYTSLLKKGRHIHLLDSSGIVDTRRDSSSNRMVTTTWHISFEHIENAYPKAAELFALLSMFDHQSIPWELVQQDCIRERKAEQIEKTHDAEDEQCQNEDFDLELEDNITMLINYSLLSIKGDGISYKIHRIVQLSMRRWLENNHRLIIYQSRSIRILNMVFPAEAHPTSMLCKTLLPHVRKVIIYDVDESVMEEKIILLHKLGTYFHHDYLLSETENIFRMGIRLATIHLGPSHIATLKMTLYLAASLCVQGRYDEVEAMMRSTTASYSVLGVDKATCLRAWHWLGVSLLQRNQLQDATILINEQLERSIELVGLEHGLSVDFIICQGQIAAKMGHNNKAEALFRKAYDLELVIHPVNSVRLYNQLIRLADLLVIQKKAEEAEALLRQMPAASGLDITSLVYYLELLASSLTLQYKYREAEDLLHESLNKQRLDDRRLAGTFIANTVTKLCELKEAQNRHEEAMSLRWEYAIEFERSFGMDDKRTLYTWTQLGIALYKTRRLQEAETCLRKVFDQYNITTESNKPEDQERLVLLAYLGCATSHQNRWVDAEVCFRDALDLAESMKADEQNLSVSLGYLGECLYMQHRYKDAEPYLQRKLAIHDNRLAVAADDPKMLSTLSLLGNIYHDQGLFIKSVEMLQRALASHEALDGKDYRVFLMFDCLSKLGQSYYAQGKLVEARAYYRQAIERHDNEPIKNRSDADIVFILMRLAQISSSASEVESICRRVLVIEENLEDSSKHPDIVARSQFHLGSILLKQCRYSEAEEILRKALQSKEAIFTENDDPSSADICCAARDLCRSLYRQAKEEDALVVQRRWRLQDCQDDYVGCTTAQDLAQIHAELRANSVEDDSEWITDSETAESTDTEEIPSSRSTDAQP